MLMLCPSGRSLKMVCRKMELTCFAGMSISATEVIIGCSVPTELGFSTMETGRANPLSDTRREFWRGCHCLSHRKKATIG